MVVLPGIGTARGLEGDCYRDEWWWEILIQLVRLKNRYEGHT
jgi:hypothetical protein